MAFVGIVCPTVLSRMWYSTSKIGVRLVNLNAASIEVDFFYLSKPSAVQNVFFGVKNF
jgi:hypothetical protein